MWHYVGVAVLAGALGLAGGWRVQSWRWAAADAERIAAQAESDRLAREAADRVAVGFEAKREAIRVEQRVITREVDRVVEVPLYRNVCLDDAGLRVVAAAAGAASSAGEPGPAVPASGAAR